MHDCIIQLRVHVQSPDMKALFGSIGAMGRPANLLALTEPYLRIWIDACALPSSVPLNWTPIFWPAVGGKIGRQIIGAPKIGGAA